MEIHHCYGGYLKIHIPGLQIISSGKHSHSYCKWQSIVDLPINSMVIFHSYVNVYQRVPSHKPNKFQLCPAEINADAPDSSSFLWCASSARRHRSCFPAEEGARKHWIAGIQKGFSRARFSDCTTSP